MQINPLFFLTLYCIIYTRFKIGVVSVNSNKNKQEEHVMFERRKKPSECNFTIERLNISNPSSLKYYHYHDDYELYYLYSGERYYFVKDKTYHVKPGTLVLVKPYDVHYTSNCDEYGYNRHLVEFSKEYLGEFLSIAEKKELLKCFHRDISIIKLNIHDQHYVETLLSQINKEYVEKKDNYELVIKTQLMQLLVFMNRRSGSLQDNDIDYYNATHKIISQITAYINTNYQKDISLTGISKEFFISPYHLSRTFKKNTGFSFIEYLNGIRVKEAQNLLRNSHKGISEIAEMVGYNSTTHFGRIFKNVTGVSPMAYKRLYRKENK